MLCIEYLSRALNSKVSNTFKYHQGCEKDKLNHLCFADDLFIFYYGDLPSVKQISDILKHFQQVSRLQVNADKS